jgi:hypothetical protein
MFQNSGILTIPECYSMCCLLAALMHYTSKSSVVGFHVCMMEDSSLVGHFIVNWLLCLKLIGGGDLRHTHTITN